MPVDRLSELPNSILLEILSLLPIEDVIKTSFLSKRWINLWTTVPCLNFTDMFEKTNEKVRNFVNQVLLFWKGTKMLKFNFVIRDGTTLACDIDLWVQFAVNKNVEELNINLRNLVRVWEEGEDKELPTYMALHSCSWMTKLSLVGCNLKIHGSPTWSQLKTLKLAEFCYTEDLINRIMLGSPLLEELELQIVERDADLNIQSTSLKMLKIHSYYFYGPLIGSTLRICCANLKTLEMSGDVLSDYRLDNVSSLRDVTLALSESYHPRRMRPEKLFANLVANLVSATEHVERLTLSSWCFEVLTASENLLRPLPNVKFMDLEFGDFKHKRLVDFLAYFPNLKMLVLRVVFIDQDASFIDKPLEAEEGLSTSSLPPLRAVEIHASLYGPTLFQFIVFLLNHCSMLQKLVICPKDFEESTPEVMYIPVIMYKAAQLLLSLQRSFPTTQIILN